MKVHYLVNLVLLTLPILWSGIARSVEIEIEQPFSQPFVASIMNLDINGEEYDVYFSYRDVPDIIGDEESRAIFRFWEDEDGAELAAAAIVEVLNESSARFVTFDEAIFGEAILVDRINDTEIKVTASGGLSIAIGPISATGGLPARRIVSLEKDDFEWTDTSWYMPAGGGKPWAIIVPSGSFPNAFRDAFIVTDGRVTQLDVLFNDRFLNNGPYTVSVGEVTGPAEVTVAANNELIFLPLVPSFQPVEYNNPNGTSEPSFLSFAANVSRTASFGYTIVDRDGNSASAVVEVEISQDPVGDSSGSGVSLLSILSLLILLVRRRICLSWSNSRPNQHEKYALAAQVPDRRTAGRFCGR